MACIIAFSRVCSDMPACFEEGKWMRIKVYNYKAVCCCAQVLMGGAKLNENWKLNWALVSINCSKWCACIPLWNFAKMSCSFSLQHFFQKRFPTKRAFTNLRVMMKMLMQMQEISKFSIKFLHLMEPREKFTKTLRKKCCSKISKVLLNV
jgi:hypothetical protein